jgi:RNA polymerase sigma-70 factor (sigma-E family)
VTSKDNEIREFLEKHGKFLINFAANLTSNPDSAQDLLQESLIRLYPKWRLIKVENRLAYLKQILVRQNISTWRRRRWRENENLEEDLEASYVFDEDSLDTELLRTILNDLPSLQRTAIVLRYMYDFPLNETAKIMKLPVNTVKSHCARGLKTLRLDESLNNEFGEFKNG